MKVKLNLKKLIFPSLNFASLIRIIFIILLTIFVFTQILIPVRLKGKSMEPTLKDGSFHFIIRSFFKNFKRGDIVAIRIVSNRILLLKRIIAFEGEVVEFRDGKLFINGEYYPEPYITVKSDWNYPPKKVSNGKIFVVGDNRSVPIEMHDFGEVSKERIVGKLLW